MWNQEPSLPPIDLDFNFVDFQNNDLDPWNVNPDQFDDPFNSELFKQPLPVSIKPPIQSSTRRHTRFTLGQRKALKLWITSHESRYVPKADVLALAKSVGLTEQQVRVFFTNYRMRNKAYQEKNAQTIAQLGQITQIVLAKTLKESITSQGQQQPK
jgi:hypothetical protein